MKYFLIALCFFVSACLLKAQVTIQSTIPGTLGINTEFKFEVRINKGGVANFSKYQMDVPAGITISEVDSKTGSFSFENNRAKIIWVTTPVEPEFVITMKLNSGSGSSPGTIHQKFYYLEGGTKKEAEAEPVNIVFSASGSLAAEKATSAAPAAPAVTTKEIQPSTNTIVETSPAKESAAAPAPRKEAPVETIKPAEKKNTVQETATAATGGIVYKVQLAASAEKPLASKYASLQQVIIAKEGTMYKVLVGSFTNKEDAVKMKTDLAAKGFNGFVVAYQNGERVK